MRILYIHQYFATRRGTTGTRSLEQARAMQAAGHQVTMLTSSAQLRPEEIPAGRGVIRCGVIEGIEAVVLHVPYQQRMGYLRRIWSFLKFMVVACWVVLTRRRADLVFATSTPLTVGVPALVGKLLRGIPFFFEVRDLWPDVPAALGILRNALVIRILKSMELAFYRHARAIVAVNGDVAAAIGRATAGRKKIIVVPNACDTDFFRPQCATGEFRRAHGLVGKVICVHAGAMGRVNHLGAVLDAAAAMRGDDRVRFVLIGEGSEKPGLTRRAEQEQLTNVLILDAMPKTELAGVLAESDIGLMTVAPVPELEWNCANKLFDYLASGLPVVLNYQGWQGRLLREHGCGLSAAQGDPAAFGAAIRRLTDDEAIRKRMSLAARQLAETQLERRAVVRPLLAAIEELDVSSGR